MLPGRTDNVVKNHFYSTLRRQLRSILRYIHGESASEPEEVSIEFLQQLMKDNQIPITEIDNENVRNLLTFYENNGISKNTKTHSKIASKKYALYYLLLNLISRQTTTEKKVWNNIDSDNEGEKEYIKEKPILKRKKIDKKHVHVHVPAPAPVSVPVPVPVPVSAPEIKESPNAMSLNENSNKICTTPPFISNTGQPDSQELFVIESDKQRKIISRKSMDDTDLLVSLHNFIVIYLILIKQIVVSS